MDQVSIERKESRRPALLSLNAYHYRRGGADNVYFDHAALMARHGWETSFYSMHHAENIDDRDEKYFAEEINYYKSESIFTKVIQATKIIYSFEARKKISQLLDSRKIDVAHVHSIYHHQSPSVLMELRRRGIPTVLTAHDLKLACPAYTMLNDTGVCERCKGGRIWNVALHRCIKGSLAASSLIMLESGIHKLLDIYTRNVDTIIAPSQFYRDKLIEWGYDASKIVHVPNFVADRHEIMPKIGGEYLLYFGRLSKEKGLVTLVLAAATSGVPVRIAGRGPQEAELRDLVAELSAPVEFVGFKSGDALWEQVDGARAVVLPSEWYENGPLSVIEAFQRGKPLIGAAIGGIPELIVEGETGWAFQSGDVHGLADLMSRVIDVPNDQLQFMAASCRHLSRTRYSEESYFEAISKLYEQLLK